MGWFRKSTAADPEEIERLKSEIAIMSARLSASDQQKLEIGEQVQSIVARLDTPIAPPPDEPPPPPPPSVDPAEIDMLHAKIERLSTKIDDVASTPAPATADPAAASAEQAEQIGRIDDRLQRVNARIEEIDQRITSISTELANQLTELSTELDAIHSAQPPDGETVDELRDSQTRLAEEQARYQIAFRKDLAELADRLKRA